MQKSRNKKTQHIRLSVNLNKVALLRNTRHTGVPNVVEYADLAIESGAHGITLHPRSDERHVRKSDVLDIAKRMKSVRPRVELNIEGYPDERFFSIIAAVKPEQCTLVPDAPDAFTSDEGWLFTTENRKLLRQACTRLKKSGARVILFVEPGFADFEHIRDVGADGIEIYTGAYAIALNTKKEAKELKKIATTARRAQSHGLRVHIGHDLNLKNIPPLVVKLGSTISEASIGHEFTADALIFGFRETIKKYIDALNPSAPRPAEAIFDDPHLHFKKWYSESTSEKQPNAMILSTASAERMPSSRVVFLREHGKKGFTFFTNYGSRKAREIKENPRAALLFYWNSVGRQIRITGHVSKTTPRESRMYFETRPRENQLSAWASSQSDVLESPRILGRRMNALRKKFLGKKIPLPPHWGGFTVVPDVVEFWEQGSAGRLHTRTQYVLKKGRWKKELLSP